MKCRKCGSELDSDSVFCPECGTRVERLVENNSGDIVRDNVQRLIFQNRQKEEILYSKL